MNEAKRWMLYGVLSAFAGMAGIAYLIVERFRFPDLAWMQFLSAHASRIVVVCILWLLAYICSSIAMSTMDRLIESENK